MKFVMSCVLWWFSRFIQHIFTTTRQVGHDIWKLDHQAEYCPLLSVPVLCLCFVFSLVNIWTDCSRFSLRIDDFNYYFKSVAHNLLINHSGLVSWLLWMCDNLFKQIFHRWHYNVSHFSVKLQAFQVYHNWFEHVCDRENLTWGEGVH